MKRMLQILRSKNSTKFYKNLLFLTSLNQLVFLNLAAQGTTNLFTIPASNLSSSFVGTGNFNAVIFGDLEASRGDTEGRLAVGGKFSFNAVGYGYSVGLAGPGVGSSDAPNNTDNFVVNGNFNNLADNWQVRGNFIYNTANSGISMPSQAAPGTTSAGIVNHILFSSQLTRYKNLSASLDDLPKTGSVSHANSWDPITLKGNRLVNVFEVTIPSGHNTGFDIDIPSGSTAVVNVTNTTVSINGGNMTVSTVGIPTYGAGAKVIFNFPKATQISLKNFGMLGSFMAPYASLTGNGGSINGQTVVGGNVTQSEGFEFHNFSFLGSFETALPVTLLDFKAVKESGAVSLEWSTTSESNSSHFEVQRSGNGKDWNTIGTVAANEQSAELRNYGLADNRPLNGNNLYRLKMVDRDETFAYSRIISVKTEGNAEANIFPNPVSDRLLVNNTSGIEEIIITDLSGRNVYRSRQVPLAGIDCSSIATGAYLITFRNANGQNASKKIVVAR